jgi:effector-associated domain 11 (EAD11)-containing protein
MAIAEFKQNLKDRIAVDTQEVFRVLDRHIEPKRTIYNDLKLLQSQFSDVHADSGRGTLPYEDTLRFKTRVRQSLMKLIDELRIEDLRKKKEYKILVICKDDDDKAYMEQYFAALSLEAKVKKTLDYFPPDDYSLIVFDAHSIGSVPKEDVLKNLPAEKQKFLELLLLYLRNAPKWLVYYGEFNYLLNDYRDTTNAANNKFSLYARMKEMNDFLEDYQVGRNKE